MADDWRRRAACRGLDPNLFHPGRGDSTKKAKDACRECPVREACLEHALAAPETRGIWGGLGARQRRRIRGARARMVTGA